MDKKFKFKIEVLYPIFWFLVFYCTLLLYWPARVNGYPFVFSDSSGYIKTSMFFKPIAYSLFIAYTSLGTSLWPVLFFQSLITSIFLVRISWLLLGSTDSKGYKTVLIISFLLLFSDIAQYVSWIMPDIASSWLFLGGILFFLSNKSWDRCLAIGGMTLALSFHCANLVVALLFLPVLYVFLKITNFKNTYFWKEFHRLIAVICFILLFVASLNLVYKEKFGLFPPKNERFMFTKLTHYGLLSSALDEYCSTGVKRKICKNKDECKAADGKDIEWILWNSDSPLRKFHALSYVDELGDLTGIMIKRNLGTVIKRNFIDTFTLLFRFDIDDDYSRRVARICDVAVKVNFRSEFRYFLQSRQHLGLPVQLSIIPWVSRFYYLFVWGSMAGFIFLLVRYKDKRFIYMGCALFLFLFINAYVNASISGVFGRYNMKVVWLIQFLFVLQILSIFFNKKLPQTHDR